MNSNKEHWILCPACGSKTRARLLPDNVLDIMVKDRGCGIADLEQACRPMFTTGGEERSGMGFTIMESFMDKLTVRSVPGKGTTVQMRKRIVPRLVSR